MGDEHKVFDKKNQDRDIILKEYESNFKEKSKEEAKLEEP